jgi:hypothetical protein
MPRHTEPEAHQQMILEKLKLALPPQPPPRIRAGKPELAARHPRNFVVQTYRVKTTLATPECGSESESAKVGLMIWTYKSSGVLA